MIRVFSGNCLQRTKSNNHRVLLADSTLIANVHPEGSSIGSQGDPKHPQSFAQECIVSQNHNQVLTNQTTKLMISMIFDVSLGGLSGFTVVE